MAGTNSTRSHNYSRYKDALERSGYLVESRVGDILDAAGWFVRANTLVVDPADGSTHELDLSATRWPSPAKDRRDIISAHLVVECVNNPLPLVFFDSKQDFADLFITRWKYSGVPMDTPLEKGDGAFGRLGAVVDALGKHHYCHGPFATQYCSFTEKRDSKGNGTLMASHHESHHGAFKTLPICVEAEMAESRADAHSVAADGRACLRFVYPMLVVSGELLRGVVSPRGVRLTRVHHVQLLTSVLRGTTKESYLIDVTTEAGLKRLLPKVDAELAGIVDWIAAHPAAMSAGIDYHFGRLGPTPGNGPKAI